MKNFKTKKQLENHVTELVVKEFKNKKMMYDELDVQQVHIDTFCAVGTTKARHVAQENGT